MIASALASGSATTVRVLAQVRHTNPNRSFMTGPFDSFRLRGTSHGRWADFGTHHGWSHAHPSIPWAHPPSPLRAPLPRDLVRHGA